jgi:poly [ADP-ribose] polymerase
MYNQINKYIQNTQGSTHKFNLKLLDVFEIEQNDKRAKYEEATKNLNNKTLLFHGSSITNWISILKHDLMINPQAVKKDVYICGKMFGNGIYFANCVSKSWGYCRTEQSNNIGCLALAEVALGNVSKRIDADYDIDHNSLLRKGYDSVQGLGKTTPNGSVTIDDTIIPNGALTHANNRAYLQYDEFIVYKSEHQLIKYLVIVKDEK